MTLQKFEECDAITPFKENSCAMVAPLRDVMGHSGQEKSGVSGHTRMLNAGFFDR